MRKFLLEMLVESVGVVAVCKTLFKAEDGSPMSLTSYQTDIIRNIVFKYPKYSICTASTRAGKSLAVSLGVILLACLKDGEKVRIVAPTYSHTRIVMGYIISHIMDHEFLRSRLLYDVQGLGVERLKKELTKSKLVLRGNSEISALSASVGTGQASGRALVGWGGTCVVVDEAEQIPEELMRTKVMRMLGDSLDASIFCIGNPVAYGFMYKKSLDKSWAFTKITWRDCVREGRMSEEFVLDRKEEMTSNEFLVWYEADWASELEDQLFSQDSLRFIKAELSDEEKELLGQEPDEKVLGCDIARFGNDLTVLTMFKRYADRWFITRIKSFEKKDTMGTVGEILSWHREENFARINIDDTGVGGGVVDRLRENEDVRSVVFPFIFGELPHKGSNLSGEELEDNKLFSNKKAFYYRKFSSLAKKGLVRLAVEEHASVLLKQLMMMRYEFQSNGKMKVVDPSDKSPDFADSAMVAFWEGKKFMFDFA